MATNDTCRAVFPANPDIAGIGIRISVYVTTVLLSLFSGAQTTGAVGVQHSALLIATAGLQGLTLLITAIVQTFTRQLSLYHGFIIFHLLAFLGFQLIPSYFRSADVDMIIRLIVGSVVQLLATAAYMSWMIYLMVTAPTFGPANFQHCNDRVLYVFFFKSVPATKKWIRIVAGIFGALPLQITFPIVGPILTSVYGIVTLELVVHRNAFIVDKGEDEWGFGQILAMVLLLQVLKELLDGFLSLFEGTDEIKSPGFFRSIFHTVPLLKAVLGYRRPLSIQDDEDGKVQMNVIPSTPNV